MAALIVSGSLSVSLTVPSTQLVSHPLAHAARRHGFRTAHHGIRMEDDGADESSFERVYQQNFESGTTTTAPTELGAEFVGSVVATADISAAAALKQSAKEKEAEAMAAPPLEPQPDLGADLGAATKEIREALAVMKAESEAKAAVEEAAVATRAAARDAAVARRLRDAEAAAVTKLAAAEAAAVAAAASAARRLEEAEERALVEAARAAAAAEAELTKTVGEAEARLERTRRLEFERRHAMSERHVATRVDLETRLEAAQAAAVQEYTRSTSRAESEAAAARAAHQAERDELERNLVAAKDTAARCKRAARAAIDGI